MPDQFRAILAIILVAFILLASNTLAEKDEKAEQDPVEQPTYSEIQYSALRTEDKVDFGLTLLCEQSGGAFEGELSVGAPYSLDMFNGAKWIVCDTLIPEEEIAWTMELYLIQEGGSAEWDVDWTTLYGELQPGSYRISKHFMDDASENTYFAYFTVE